MGCQCQQYMIDNLDTYSTGDTKDAAKIFELGGGWVNAAGTDCNML